MKNKEKIKGLELSKRYFEEVYLPAFKEKIPHILPKMAIGLAGDGSECFGYDDEISQDHDFGPSCCIWLTESDYNLYKNEIENVLYTLPKEFLGFEALNTSEWGVNRRSILNISDWYYNFIGMEDAPTNLYDWRLIPETALATAINGEVFLDNLGIFSEIRRNLKKYFPEDIRLNKIATRCMKIAQSGQYNFLRCMKRNEIVAAKMAESEFVDEAIHLTYLLNKKYKLFYKWMHRDMYSLPILGEEIHNLILELSLKNISEYNEKFNIIEKICSLLINEIKNQNLVNSNIKSDFLLDYGPLIQSKIKDEKLKNWSPWLD